MAFEDFWFSEQAVPPAGASLRFSGNQQLTWTQPSMVGVNQTTWTQSMWVKRAILATSGTAADQYLMGCNYIPTENFYQLAFSGIYGGVYNDTLFFGDYFKNSAWIWVTETAAVYRDPGAWMHVCVVYDSNNAVPADRQRVYINGVRNLAFGPYGNQGPTLGQTSWWTDTLGSSGLKYIGGTGTVGGGYLNGYLSDVFSVNGLALSPTEFGKFDSNGVWVPLEFTTAKANVITAGGFGTNGFALRFESQYFNSGTLVWADQSGNGNDFTANWNCQVGAVTAAGTDITNDGPPVNLNTLNPLPNAILGPPATGPWTTLLLTSGNLAGSAFGEHQTSGTNLVLTGGKWYFEYTSTNAGGIFNTTQSVGFARPNANTFDLTGPYSWTLTTYDGNVNNSGVSTPYAPGTGSGPVGIIGCALDLDNGKIWWSRGGVFPGSGDPVAGTGAAFTNVVGPVMYVERLGGGGPFTLTSYHNFGQYSFTYTVPTGFKPLTAANLPAAPVPNGETGFKTVIDTGANILTSAQAAAPNGLWWIYGTNADYNSRFVDSVRGSGLMFLGAGNNSEVAYSAPPATQATAMCFPTSGAASANTNGTITSNVSVNSTSQFSIVTYTGNGVNGATIGHGLSQTPGWILVQELNGPPNATVMYMGYYGATKFQNFNAGFVLQTLSTIWNDTAPTSSVFTVGTDVRVNQSGINYVAYCWAMVPGFSAQGVYAGNSNNNGPFIYTGFRPQFVITKDQTSSNGWWLRSPLNLLYNPVSSNVDKTNLNTAVAFDIDFVSNGFKIRSQNSINTSSEYWYVAFAGTPFGGSNVSPGTAF
jgi:hypothetical protein